MATPQTHRKCRVSGHIPNLLNHNLHFKKIPNDSYVLWGLESTNLYRGAIGSGLGRKKLNRMREKEDP